MNNTELKKKIQDLVTQRNDWRDDAKKGNRGYAREHLRESNNPLMEMIMSIDCIYIHETRYQAFRVWFNSDGDLCVYPLPWKRCPHDRFVVGLSLKQLLAMYRDYLKSQ